MAHEASLDSDETCDSEEGCSLSLRQLRAHSAAQAAQADAGQPVSYVLPCTEPSLLERKEPELLDLLEIKDEEGTSSRDGCFQSNAYWREKNNAITMRGTHRTKEASPEACQAACAKVPGCGHFSFWSDGGCLLTSTEAHAVPHGGVVSGGPDCGSTDTYQAPSYQGPSTMAVGARDGIEPPSTVQQYNGMEWPSTTITDDKEHHMFAIGDWGGLLGTNPGQMVQPFGDSLDCVCVCFFLMKKRSKTDPRTRMQ